MVRIKRSLKTQRRKAGEARERRHVKRRDLKIDHREEVEIRNIDDGDVVIKKEVEDDNRSLEDDNFGEDVSAFPEEDEFEGTEVKVVRSEDPRPFRVCRQKKTEGVQCFDKHCLLCYQSTKQNVTAAFRGGDAAEANLCAMFILQRILKVPRNKLADYLQLVGSPSEWLVFCSKCLSVVDKAFKLHMEINRLRRKLRKYETEMLEEIKTSWREEEQVVGIQKATVTVPETVLETFRAIHEIRNYVYFHGSPMSHKLQRRLRLRPPSASSSDASSDDGDDEGSEEERQESPPLQSTFCVSISSEATTNNEGGTKGFKAPVIIQCPFEKHSTDSEVDDFGDMNTDHSFEMESTRSPSPPVVKPRTKLRKRKIIDRDTMEEEYSSSECDTRALIANGYSCSSCPNLGTMTFVNLMYHGLFHLRRPFKCSECGFYFLSSSELNKCPLAKSGSHSCSSDTLVKTSFQPGNVWECSNCSEKFASDSERDSHELNCESTDAPEINLNYNCCTCPKKFRSLAERFLHLVLEHPSNASHSCLVCSQTFSDSTKEGVQITNTLELSRHLKKHRDYSHYTRPSDCDFCGTIFPQSNDLQSHMESVHNLKKNTAYSCPICDNSRWQTRANLMKHLVQVHNLGNQQVEKETLICDMCAYKTKTKLAYLEHQFSKHEVQPDPFRKIHECSKEGCSFRTLVKESLSKHMMKEHAEERKHICQYCGKGFLDPRHRRGHEQIHRNKEVKPYQCEICGNSFAVRNYLNTHMRLSHQNRPFASTKKKKPERPEGEKPRERRKKGSKRSKLQTPPIQNLEEGHGGEINQGAYVPILFGNTNYNLQG